MANLHQRAVLDFRCNYSVLRSNITARAHSPLGNGISDRRCHHHQCCKGLCGRWGRLEGNASYGWLQLGVLTTKAGAPLAKRTLANGLLSLSISSFWGGLSFDSALEGPEEVGEPGYVGDVAE